MDVLPGGDIVVRGMGKFVQRHVPTSIGIDVTAPPRHDQPALLQEPHLVDIRGPHRVAFLVADLPLNGGVSP